MPRRDPSYDEELPMYVAAVSLLLLLATAPAAAIALKPGDLVVIDTNSKAIVHIDPETGARQTISQWTRNGDARIGFPGTSRSTSRGASWSRT